MSLKPPESEAKTPSPDQAEQEPTPFTITVSATKPESAIINGGLWVLTIPMNRLPRFMIVGFAYDAFHRLLNLLDEMDAAKEKRRNSLISGVKDFAQKTVGGLLKQ